MDVREKLVELIFDSLCCHEETSYKLSEKIADDLIKNGVTVQDGKPLEEFLHPIDAYKGLKAKYLVFKADTGERVGNCFVLRPDKDPAAVEAIRAYASATDNETLTEDIYNWVGKGVTVQECGYWVSLTDCANAGVYCSVCHKKVYKEDYAWCNRKNKLRSDYCPHCGAKMMPHPPKGE